MLELAVPHRRYRASYLAAADEFVAAGEEMYAGLPAAPAGPGFTGFACTRDELASPATFARFVSWLVALADPDTPRPADHVPCTERWMVDGDVYLGRISVRHGMTALLYVWGGQVGYAVRPSARGRGHATRALALALPVCADLGLDPVLVTCDSTNPASRRVIERNGGVLEDVREGKARFWVPTRS